MYNKLFTKILDSSIWLEPDATRLVWLTIIAAMDEDGFAQFASVGNLAHRARVSPDGAARAVLTLESPDPDSSDRDHEGRRMERVDGGWMVLNSNKYRDLVTRAVARQRTRERVQRHRDKVKNNPTVTVSNATSRLANGDVTQSEAYSEARSRSDPDPSSAESADPDKPKIEDTRAVVPRARAAELVSNHSRPTNLINGSEQRRHGSHAWCSTSAGRDGLCVQPFLHSEFIGKGAKTDAQMREWYAATVQSMNGTPIGEDVLIFWRNKFAEWVGVATEKPAINSKASDKGSRTLAAARRVIAKQIDYQQQKALTDGTK